MSKKGGKPPKEQPSYELRDIVLAKVRGFPAWPAMIVDPESVPSGVLKERPPNKKSNFYCVRFFPAGDYAWLVPKDISKLQRHEIEAYINEPFKRSGDLLTGYRVALDPTSWEAQRLAMTNEAQEEEANAEVDQLDSENEGDEDDEKKPAKTKKRKRESDVAPAAKSKSKPKVKKELAEPAKKKGSGATKLKKNGSKSKTTVESEDDADHAEADDDDDAGPSKKTSPPPAKKVKRDKEADDEGDHSGLTNDPEAIKVRDWRHRLQKAFLSNKGLPKAEDMVTVDQLLAAVESYDKMNIQYLSFSKIGKVMRHITALPADKVPRNDEFKFIERACALVARWHQILPPTKTNGNGNDSTMNGAVKTPRDDEQPTGTEESNGKTLVADESAMSLDAKGEDDVPEEAVIPPPAEPTEAPEQPVIEDGGDQTTVNEAAMTEDVVVKEDVAMAEAAEVPAAA